MKITTYVVFWLGAGDAMHNNFTDIGKALDFCQELRNDINGDTTHVVLSSDNIDQIGELGVNAVTDGKLPDGSDYTWTMRRYNERSQP